MRADRTRADQPEQGGVREAAAPERTTRTRAPSTQSGSSQLTSRASAGPSQPAVGGEGIGDRSARFALPKIGDQAG